MHNLLKNNKAYLFPYALLLLILIPILLSFSKESVHLFINDRHNTASDYFFKYITHFGDGLMPLILALLFLFFSFRKSLILVSAGLFAGILAQFFKRIVFPDIVRPAKYFEGIHDLYLVEGVKIHGSFSFPSGHSATIFALTLCLAFFAKNKMIKFFLFVLSLLVAFSRVYISQHFLNDIVAGSIVGCFAAFIMYIFLRKVDNPWLDESIIKVVTKRNIIHE